jgi:hypothetical protein
MAGRLALLKIVSDRIEKIRLRKSCPAILLPGSVKSTSRPLETGKKVYVQKNYAPGNRLVKEKLYTVA